MCKHSFHTGGTHSNYKFGSGLKAPRPADSWVLWVVLACVVIGFVVEVL